MNSTAAIIGTTTWGTTLGVILARRNVPVAILSRTAEEAERFNTDRQNRRFLPGVPFPDCLTVDSDPARVVGRPAWLSLPYPPTTFAATCNGSPTTWPQTRPSSACPKGWSFPAASG